MRCIFNYMHQAFLYLVQFKIVLGIISNTNISLDDIELILLLNIKNSYRKNLYEILIKKFNNIEFFKNDKIYFFNIKTVS